MNQSSIEAKQNFSQSSTEENMFGPEGLAFDWILIDYSKQLKGAMSQFAHLESSA